MIPICANCGRPMFCSKTGRTLAEFNSTDGGLFQLRSSDEFSCSTCNARICIPARDPFSERGVDEAIDFRYEAAVRAENMVRVTYGPKKEG